MSQPPRSAYAAWIAVCIIWGTTYLGIRVALEATPPALMGGIRWTIAGSILALAALARGERLPAPALWGSLALQGLLMIGFGNGLVNWAEQHVPSGLAAVTLATSPFWMSGVEALRADGERLSRGALVGLLLGFTGIVVLVWPDLTLGDAAGWQFTLGVIALQGACLSWAIGSSYSKRHPHGGSVLAATAVQMLLGGAMMAAAGTVLGEWPRVHLEGRGLVALGYLILVGSIGGFVSYVYALQHLPMSTVSLYAYANPLIAVVLGAALLDEPFTLRTVISMTIVFAGMMLVRRKKAPAAPGTSHSAHGTKHEAPHNAPGTRHRALS